MSRTCPTRAEFIQFRKQTNQRYRRPQKLHVYIGLGLDAFPDLPASEGVKPT